MQQAESESFQGNLPNPARIVNELVKVRCSEVFQEQIQKHFLLDGIDISALATESAGEVVAWQSQLVPEHVSQDCLEVDSTRQVGIDGNELG